MNKEKILEIIKSHIYEVVPELNNHTFQNNDNLKELGANSIDRADIIMMTMESLSLQIPRIEVFGAVTIGELADIFYEKMQSK